MKKYYYRDGPIVDGAPRREEYEIAEISDLPEACPEPMTRNQLLALEGSYRTECHYVINNHDRGTVGPALIMLHATDANTLSMNVSVQTEHDDMAWLGVYDIGADRFRHLRDNVRNEVTGQATIESFPWGTAGVVNNVVHNATVTYTAGTFSGNHIETDAIVIINGNQFTDNRIGPEANVNYTSTTGNFYRNTIGNESNITVSGGDFTENVVDSDASVNSSTTGDVDHNEFGSLAAIVVTGAANVDTCIVKQGSNLTVNGGSLTDTTLDQDAQVILYGGNNYENHFGTSVIFSQVDGTDAFIRYSTFNGTTTWVNGQVNLSNVDSYTATVNTTGSVGAISNSGFNRATMSAMQNVPDLTITDCQVTSYATFTITGADEFYIYRGTVSDGGRIIVSAGATFKSSYPNVNSYGYIQVLQGELVTNRCNVSSSSYIQQNSTGTNQALNCTTSSNGYIRFLNETDGCRVYYSSAMDGGKIYHSGAGKNNYIYYSTATSNGSIYSIDSDTARIYYSNASGNGWVYSQGNTSTHYLYYNNANAGGRVQMLNCDGSRMYSVSAESTSICRLQNSPAAGRLYYSSVTAYYYLYVTLSATRSAIHGYGRKTNTVTDPSSGAPTENFI